MSRPLVAVDIDDTLIESRPAAAPESPDELVVERRRDGTRAVVDALVPGILAAIAAEATLVPATARDVQQYERLSGLWPHQPQAWAITACGAIVLRDGRQDERWQEQTRADLGRVAPIAEVVGWLRRLAPAAAIRQVVGAVAVASPVPFDGDIDVACEVSGWRAVRSGRKLYAIASTVDKSNAVRFVAEQTGSSVIIAAGDSDLDLDMLRGADVAIIPDRGAFVEASVAPSTG